MREIQLEGLRKAGRKWETYARNTVTSPLLRQHGHTLRRRSLDRFLFFIFSSSFSLCSAAAASARSLVLRSCLAACAMVPLLLLLLLLQSPLLQPSSPLHYHQSSLFPLPSVPQAPSLTTSSLVATTTCVCIRQAVGTSVSRIVCMWMVLMLQQPQDSLQQPQRKMLQPVVLMLLACAAAATHPVSLHCAELPPLPLLSFLPSTLLSSLLPLLAQTSHAVLCSARWGSCCRAPSFYLSNVLLFMLLYLFRHSFPPCEWFFFHRSCCLILHKWRTKDEGAKAVECLQIIFLTSCLSLTMICLWHLPPGNGWREGRVVRDGSL